ncbi:unnamed protein product [Absidia cylindrospora]
MLMWNPNNKINQDSYFGMESENWAPHHVSMAKQIYEFFKLFVPEKSGDHDLDSHLLLGFFIVKVCNAILWSTGYQKFCRKMLPFSKPSTLHSLHVNTEGLYGMYSTLIRPSENIQPGELQINSLLVAKDNKDAVFAKFFDLPKLHRLCLDENLHFDHRLTITSFDAIHIQAKGSKPAGVLSGKKKRKVGKPTSSNKSKNGAATYQQCARNLDSSIKNEMAFIKSFMPNTKIIIGLIKSLNNDINSTPNSESKQPLIQRRQAKKQELYDLNRSILQHRKNVNTLRSEKSLLYAKYFEPATSTPSPSESSTSKALVKQANYYGIDPGVKTMATSIKMDSTQAGFYLLLANKYAPLYKYLEQNQDVAKDLLTVDVTSITAKSISSQSRMRLERSRLQTRKNLDKQQSPDGNSIFDMEQNLPTIGKQTMTCSDIKSNIVSRSKYGKDIRLNMFNFYHGCNGSNKEKRNRRRFTDKAFGNAATRLLKGGKFASGSKGISLAFYGDAGRGFGSRITGHEKRSTKHLQLAMAQKNCTVVDTDEYRSSKSRDMNAAINILKIGLYHQVTGGSPYPAFSRNHSSTNHQLSAEQLFGSSYLGEIMENLHPV